MRKIVRVISGLFMVVGAIYLLGTAGIADTTLIDLKSLVIHYMIALIIIGIGFAIGKSEGFLNA